MSKKNAKAKVEMIRRYRDAETGRFVTKKYAKKNRKTTLRESAPLLVRASPASQS
jgi:hypothetical protein